jgi:uncharacterized protein YciI
MLSRSLIGIALTLTAWFGWSIQEPKPAAQATAPGHPTEAWHVLFEMGAKYDPKVDTMQQPAFAGHLAFVHKMAGEGDLLLGGPLIDAATPGKLTGAAMLLRAKDEKTVREKLASDPFVAGEVLKIASVRQMMIGAGAWIPKPAAVPAGK